MSERQQPGVLKVFWQFHGGRAFTLILLSCLMFCPKQTLGDAISTNQVLQALRHAPALELPATAAELVAKAKFRDRKETAVEVARLAIRLNPAAAAAVVNGIGSVAPDFVADIAGTVVSERAEVLSQVVTAAVCVRPSAAHEIVIAVCRVAPREYPRAALAASCASAESGRQILKAVAEIEPELRPFIDVELARYSRTAPPVPICLERAERARARTRATPPASGGQPRPNPPRGNGNPNPPGGRNYARP
jgi:hypothetical protein